jgi:hypothetical protein
MAPEVSIREGKVILYFSGQLLNRSAIQNGIYIVRGIRWKGRKNCQKFISKDTNNDIDES